jgi:hypothetical protein
MTEDEPGDPLDEMARENAISMKLVERLAEAGQSLHSDRPESPGRIAVGLRLLKQYRTLHARRFRDHLEPEARVVAMPGCFEHLDVLDRQNIETDPRWGRVADTLDAYARGEAGALERLAGELDTFTQEEYDRVRFEGDYPLSCLASALPADAAGRVSTGFAKTRVEIADLERHIGRYLAERPGTEGTRFAIHCRSPGCVATGEAETFPAVNGHLGIHPPSGWKAVSRRPRVTDGKVVVDLDFSCPTHAGSAEGEGQGPSDGGTNTSQAKSLPVLDEPNRKCTCCDPIPEDLA